MAENCITVISHDVIWTHYAVIYSLQRPINMTKMLMFQRKCVAINFMSFESQSRWQSAGCDAAWFNLLEKLFSWHIHERRFDCDVRKLWVKVKWLDINFVRAFCSESFVKFTVCVGIHVRCEFVHNWWSKLNCRNSQRCTYRALAISWRLQLKWFDVYVRNVLLECIWASNGNIDCKTWMIFHPFALKAQRITLPKVLCLNIGAWIINIAQFPADSTSCKTRQH